MAWAWSGPGADPGRGHVAIANGLDFFQAMFFDNRIKMAEHFVEQFDRLRRGHAGRERGEVHHIGKQDAGAIEGIRDRAGFGF